ncbi:hypothetical protein GCM10023238_11360 [Streptomyces heliomycini]
MRVRPCPGPAHYRGSEGRTGQKGVLAAYASRSRRAVIRACAELRAEGRSAPPRPAARRGDSGADGDSGAADGASDASRPRTGVLGPGAGGGCGVGAGLA